MKPPVSYLDIDSPIGPLRLVADAVGLRRIDFLPAAAEPAAPVEWERSERALAPARTALEAYFAGTLHAFALPLAPEGTEFQQKVWRALCEIPYGETICYGDLALRIGNPSASRAVGLANGRNPLPIVVPCHRVIGKNGTLVGYGGGLPIKEKLLALERCHRPSVLI